MKSLTFTEHQGRFYKEAFDSHPDDVALEKYLIGENIPHIGDMNELNQWYEQTNYKRRRAIEMSKQARFERSIAIVKRLSNISQLLKWHEIENNCGEFLMFSQIQKKIQYLAKLKIFIGKYDQQQTEDIFEEIKKCMPEFEKFNVFTVKPYNFYDLSFDGMIFHHAWDKNIFHANIEIAE